METVPTEILLQIFSYFCFHCQNPGLFPHANTDDVRENKKCLAYLCRASKAICAVAQPILYHYYASGNVLIESKLDDGQKESRLIQEHDYLPQFCGPCHSGLNLPCMLLQCSLLREQSARACTRALIS
jgi:hypothetical protein